MQRTTRMMMWMASGLWMMAYLALALMMGTTARAEVKIDLVLQCSYHQRCADSEEIDTPFDVFEIFFYAIPDKSDCPDADCEADDALAVSAILRWDKRYLEFLGAASEDDDWVWPNWQNAWPRFPWDGELDQLNTDCGPKTYCDPFTGKPFNDGTAYYNVIAPFFGAFEVGDIFLIDIFRFKALKPTPPKGTQVTFGPGKAGASETKILVDCHAPGGGFCEQNVTGELTIDEVPMRIHPAERCVRE